MLILFQGDSVTDAGRSRENDDMLGLGYPRMVEAALGLEEPTKYEFVNRGVSGDRVVDLYARIKRDLINIKPDLLSILIGVNDAWHDLGDDPNGVDTEKYYKIYDMLIEEIKAALPEVKIMILEPFCLKGSLTENGWEQFRSEVRARGVAAEKIAKKYNFPFVKLQDGFDELSKIKEESYWLKDGVHPTAKGHEFIKNEWIKAFRMLEL